MALPKRHNYVPEHEKLESGQKLTIYDAVRSYKREHGDTRPARAVLNDPTFRQAWVDFRGGGLKYKMTGAGVPQGVPTPTADKFKAAKTLGWGETRAQAVQRLRNLSP